MEHARVGDVFVRRLEGKHEDKQWFYVVNTASASTTAEIPALAAGGAFVDIVTGEQLSTQDGKHKLELKAFQTKAFRQK